MLTGCHAHGQGHETTFAQLVSERLGIPFENVSIVHGDTDKVQFGMGTYGSRSGAVGMSAIVKALDKVEAKAKKVAAFMLEAAEGDIEFKDGKFTVAGTDKSAAFGDVALNAYIAHKFTGAELEPGLKETSFYDPTNFTFPAGCHICEVEVDTDTGKTEIVNWTAVDDFGTVINPMIVEGQVHGGIAQGVGQALLEGAVYDKDGQLVTGSMMDYTMPRAHDLPSFHVGLTETKSPSNPLGIKGCGEAGAIAAPAAVINAITDAIGTENLAMPATANAVWTALQGAKPRQAAVIRRERCTISPSIVRPRSARRPACWRAIRKPSCLAGGHSLIPVMKQRLASPSALIDLSLVEGMSGVEQKGRSIVIGAMTRHADVANSPVLQQALPGLAAVPASIGDPQVRNRGTIGGSVANNDPNADYPAACLGLGATIITNKRRIAADDFFTGMFSTALEDGEIITKISFPIAKKAAYEKFKHPASGFALVGVFVSQARRRHPRGGDRRRRQRRVPGEVVRGGAEEALRGEIARRHDHSGHRHEQHFFFFFFFFWRHHHHQQAPHRRRHFFTLSTALEEGEIIVKVSFPIAKKAAYEKFKHPASGFALVGVFVCKRGADIRVAVTGAGANGVFRVKSFEEALKKRFSPKSIEGMTIPSTGMNGDIHASPEYRAHLVAVLARRALAKANA